MHVIHTLRHYTHSHTHAHGSYELDDRRTMVAVCCPQRRVAIARRRAPPPAAAQVAGEAGRRAAVMVHHHVSSACCAPVPCHERSTRCSAPDGGLRGAHGGGALRATPRSAGCCPTIQNATQPNKSTHKQTSTQTHKHTQVSTPHTLRVPSPPWCVAHEMKLRCAAAAPHLHMCDGGWRPSAAAARAPSGGPRHTHRSTHSILLMTAAVCCVCIVTMTAAEAAVRRVGPRSLTALRAQASTTAAGSTTPHTQPTQP